MASETNARIKRVPDEHGIYPKEVAERTVSRYDIRGKIGLVDADLLDGGTRHPNLVIMKLSGYFKEQGCEVHLIENYTELYTEAENPEDNDYDRVNDFDAVYISKVFDFTKIDRHLLSFSHVFFGGTGFYFDHAPALPDEIEHHMPDYHIYDDYIEHDTRHKNKDVYYKDYLNYSIGFASKGCFRQCDFCVNHNCKRVEFHSHISEWHDPGRKYIYLWDDNIFGYSRWREVFAELKEIGKPFQFRQGMDIRLLTPEKARALNEARYHGDIIFAFDNIEDEPIIEQKLALWRQYSRKATKLYVLSGFVSQDEKEIESVFRRISVIIKYGAFPYIMRHENYLNSPYRGMFIELARWCNQPMFMRNYSFREYCEANQARITRKGHISAPMQYMTEFEEKFPEIAAKYFDLRFRDQPYVIEKKRQDEEARMMRQKKKGKK